MKELSIEEKAKRYDEAIKFAKIYHNQGDEDMKTMCETMFSELKECEDERIRKEMIETIKKEAQDFPSSIIAEKSNSWLSWLEKQGEQKSIDELNQQEAMDVAVAKCFEWSEQKPADKVEPKFKAGDIIRHKEQGFTCKITAVDTEYRVSDCCGTHLPFDMQDYYELVEQKPAWSEEDDRMYNIIVSFIPQHLTAESYTACINWLKSLKDRVQPQPQWSKMDDVRLTSTIEVLEFAHSLDSYNQYGKEDIRNNLSWLKSLKNRYTWKPSNEQIKALNRAMYHVEDDVATQIAKLIGDLKKLREK